MARAPKASKKGAERGPEYLLLDTSSKLLARGELTSPPDAVNMQVQITGGSADAVVAAETVQAIPVDPKQSARLGRVILRRGNLVVLDPMRDLGTQARENLRMPVEFESFVYPEGGGRALIKADNLSCGGIAFYTTWQFGQREHFEVVIPIVDEGPLLLNAEVLRSKPMGPLTMYAAKFVDMCPDEEARVREAVFQVQLDARPMPKKK